MGSARLARLPRPVCAACAARREPLEPAGPMRRKRLLLGRGDRRGAAAGGGPAHRRAGHPLRRHRDGAAAHADRALRRSPIATDRPPALAEPCGRPPPYARSSRRGRRPTDGSSLRGGSAPFGRLDGPPLAHAEGMAPILQHRRSLPPHSRARGVTGGARARPTPARPISRSSGMLAHPTGMIGLPLRLLAREVYNRVVEQASAPEAVALVTGEEKIKPDRPRYWICTIEAMPRDLDVGLRGHRRDPARGRPRPRPRLHRPAPATGAAARRRC